MAGGGAMDPPCCATTLCFAGRAGECSQSALGAKQSGIGLGGLILSAVIRLGAKDQFAPAQFAIKSNAGKLGSGS